MKTVTVRRSRFNHFLIPTSDENELMYLIINHIFGWEIKRQV